MAGGRRLAAAGVLVDTGEAEQTYMVPCAIRSDVSEAELVENLQRQAMHPVDEFVAFKRWAGEGKTVSEIAAITGRTQKYVQQRVALGSIHRGILKAARHGALTLDCLEAFLVVPDQERQLAVYNELKGGGCIHAYHVRRELLGVALRSDTSLAVFVGKKAYLAAGGAIESDLFQQQVYFVDGELAEKLALEKLQAEAKAITGWARVEWSLDQYVMNDEYIYVEGQPTGVPKVAIQEQARLEARIAELEALDDDDAQ